MEQRLQLEGQRQFRKQTSYWIRWLLVLPASLAAFAAAALFTAIAGDILVFGKPVGWGIQSFVFVYAGAKTAPEHRLITGVVLLAAQMVLAGFGVAASWFGLSTVPLWTLVLAGIIGLGCSIWALVQIHKEERQSAGR